VILIVDDNAQNTRMLAGALEERHACRVVADAAAALEAISTQPIDLVVLDVDLAGGSGVALARQLLIASPDTAVVIVTGQEDAEIASAARERGHGFILKPFGPHEISITVDNALHRRRLELRNRAVVAELRELSDAQELLMAAVSHDLRSPLTAIAGLADLMDQRLEEFSEEQTHGILKDIVSSTTRMTATLEGLLDRDRLARGIAALD
jgi:DNA-binding NtrC family response regulator